MQHKNKKSCKKVALCCKIVLTKCNNYAIIVFATEMQQEKGGIFIEKKKKLIFDSFSKTEECIICQKKKKTCYQICKGCLIKSATTKLCMDYLAHQTKLAQKHYKFNYENELFEMYFEKYHKKFNLNEKNKKNSQSFLRKYCLLDEISFAKYIRNGGK